MRHVVRVMRPTVAAGPLGETQGKPLVIFRQWPCRIRALSGNEQEAARQISVNVQYSVEGIGDPNKPFEETDYLEFGPEDKPTRTLNIGFIGDENLNGRNIKLLCGETR